MNPTANAPTLSGISTAAIEDMCGKVDVSSIEGLLFSNEHILSDTLVHPQVRIMIPPSRRFIEPQIGRFRDVEQSPGSDRPRHLRSTS
jgi:hypothetical protein